VCLQGNSLLVSANTADEDGIEVDEAQVAPTVGDDEVAEETEGLTSSPNADTTVLFTKPLNGGAQLFSSQDVQILVGFTNKGPSEFVLDTLDASFRYAMDFSYHLQNFTAIGYNRPVRSGEQASLFYSFGAGEAFAGRPVGLTLNLIYHDATSGKYYQTAVFNKTVEIVEPDEGLDGEAFFLYLFMAAVVILLLVVVQQFLSSMSRKAGTSSSRPKMETGTQNGGNVDYEWLPKEVYNPSSKSPKSSPRQSPRQRKANKAE